MEVDGSGKFLIFLEFFRLVLKVFSHFWTVSRSKGHMEDLKVSLGIKKKKILSAQRSQ